MKHQTVIRAAVLRRQLQPSGYTEVEISARCAGVRPGQYWMLAREGDGLHWPTPHLIQRETADGSVLLAKADDLPALCAVGETILAWGPCGTSPLDSDAQTVLLVADRAAADRILPFGEMVQGTEVTLLKVGNWGENLPVPSRIAVRECADAAGAADGAAHAQGQIIAALDDENLCAFARRLLHPQRERTWVYVNTPIACGVGGCRGCHVHSAGAPGGLAVCCKGPYLPLAGIDLERDKRCILPMERGVWGEL